MAAVGCISPTRWMRLLVYYGIFASLEFTGLYFLTDSIVYRVPHN